MTEAFELVVTSSSGDSAISANIWNPETGTHLGSYKGGGICPPHGLALEAGYVIASEKGKPMLHTWPLNKLHVENNRLIAPGKVTALAVSPNALFIGLGVEEKIHIYQISSGRLIGTGVRHFRPLVVVKFNDDGTCIGCGGEDGVVTVWNLATLVSKTSCSEPTHTFSEHSLPVSDLIFTSGGIRARLISVSGDRTCKIYDIGSGNILLSLVFDIRLTSITIHALQTDLYIGNGEGDIHSVSLTNPPRNPEYHLTSTEKESIFKGHTKSITCLSCSMNGLLLLSGSQDETIKIWHILSRQCLRTIQQKGPVCNAFFFRTPKAMFEHDFKPSVILHNFIRSVDINEDADMFIEVTNTKQLFLHEEIEGEKEVSGTNEEIMKLKNINAGLYKFALDKILETKLKFNYKEPVKTKVVHNKKKNKEGRVSNAVSKIKKVKGKSKKKKQVQNKLVNTINGFSEVELKETPRSNAQKRKKKEEDPELDTGFGNDKNSTKVDAALLKPLKTKKPGRTSKTLLHSRVRSKINFTVESM